MVNIKDLKKQSSASFQKLKDEMKKSSENRFKDDRYWIPTVDAEGNGTATIRFLPASADETVPFVKYYDHNFKGPTGRYYIQKSLTTLGQKDPVSDQNSMLWNSTTDDNSAARKMARAHKRNLHYVSNIYVVNDPSHPENSGKVFLFRYGTKIWDKVNAAANPKFEGDPSFNPFDMWTGANFRLRMKKVSGFRNYDDSSFDAPSPLANNDDTIAAIWQKTYPLLPEIGPDKFLTYEQLEEKLREVVGNSADVLLGSSSPASSNFRSNRPAASSVNELPSNRLGSAPEPAQTPTVDSGFDSDPDAGTAAGESDPPWSIDDDGSIDSSILKAFNDL